MKWRYAAATLAIGIVLITYRKSAATYLPFFVWQDAAILASAAGLGSSSATCAAAEFVTKQ